MTSFVPCVRYNKMHTRNATLESSDDRCRLVENRERYILCSEESTQHAVEA